MSNKTIISNATGSIKSFLFSTTSILQECWFSYKQSHPVRDVEIREVEKSLKCHTYTLGCFVHYCYKCMKYIIQKLGCNSRLCSRCGKRYVDQWSESLSKAMFKVPHRHFVFSVASQLWSILRSNRNLWKVYMDSAVQALEDYFSHLYGDNLRVGVICFLHPFGKDLKFYPHLHLLITEGGFDRRNQFVPKRFIPANGLRKTWQYHVLTNLKKAGVDPYLVDFLFKKYSKGFYVWLHKRGRIKHPKLIAKYVGRYVRHPAIANSRLVSYDGKSVTFFYVDHDDNQIEVTMGVEEFIGALIQHIPESQFKMVRWYGAYARRTKRKFKIYLQSSIYQLTLIKFGIKVIPSCPFCGSPLEFIGYYPGKPPPEVLQQKKLLEWIEV